MSAKAVYSLCLVLLFTVTSNGWVFTDIDLADVAPELYRFERAALGDDDKSSFGLSTLKFALIYPGTKWCGAGNKAKNYDDLGKSKEADMCCRDHDNCADIMRAGESKNNLKNKAFFTRLNCTCDDEFLTCLRAAKTGTAKRIGTIYFNALDTQCYKKEYPVKACVKRGGWLKSKCLEYTYDTGKPKVYQWFDTAVF